MTVNKWRSPQHQQQLRRMPSISQIPVQCWFFFFGKAARRARAHENSRPPQFNNKQKPVASSGPARTFTRSLFPFRDPRSEPLQMRFVTKRDRRGNEHFKSYRTCAAVPLGFLTWARGDPGAPGGPLGLGFPGAPGGLPSGAIFRHLPHRIGFLAVSSLSSDWGLCQCWSVPYL